MAIMEGLNSILYSNDPNEIPLTDFEAAADMPYDTDIPEGNEVNKVWVKKARHIQKLAISKESTILVQSSWNMVKMIASWANHFYQVSLGLDKTVDFLLMGWSLNKHYINVGTLSGGNIP